MTVDITEFRRDGAELSVAIDRAIAAGCYWVLLPHGTVWEPVDYVLPSGARVTGEDVSVIIRPKDRAGAPSWLNMGSGAILEVVTIEDAMTGPGTGRLLCAWNQIVPDPAHGQSGQQTISTSGQNVSLNIVKAGRAGSLMEVGMSITHDGLGSGDNYYAQTTKGSTEYRDGLFRGDLFGTHPAGGNVLFATLGPQASPNSHAVFVNDFRRVVTGENSQGPIHYQTSTAEYGQFMTVRHDQSSFDGVVLDMGMAFGSGEFTGQYVRCGRMGVEEFAIDYDGVPRVHGRRGLTEEIDVGDRVLVVEGGLIVETRPR